MRKCKMSSLHVAGPTSVEKKSGRQHPHRELFARRNQGGKKGPILGNNRWPSLPRIASIETKTRVMGVRCFRTSRKSANETNRSARKSQMSRLRAAGPTSVEQKSGRRHRHLCVRQDQGRRRRPRRGPNQRPSLPRIVSSGCWHKKHCYRKRDL